MFSERGFTLLEVLIAAAIGVVLVLGVGVLQEGLVHRRASSNSISAATSLAERQMEQLLATANPGTASDLTAGTHGPNACASPPCKIDESGDSTVNGPYLMQWTVVDNNASSTKFVDSSSSTKHITVTVTHVSNPHAQATLVTNYKYK